MFDRHLKHTVACLAVWAGSFAWPLAPVAAQDGALPAGPLTLEQVLDRAESRSEAIAIARQGIRRAEGEQLRARSGAWPQLSVSGAYERALASEFDGVFDAGGSGTPCPPFMLNPDASLDNRVAEIERAIDCGAVGGGFFGGPGAAGPDDGLADLPFGRVHTWRVTVAFSQNLYSGGRLGAQRAMASAGRETAELGFTTTRAQLLLDVIEAYYDAVLSERLVTIAESALDQAGATLRQAQAGFDAGTQPEFEVLRARVSRDNQAPVLIRQRVQRDVALLRLKQLLELPADHDLRLADALGQDLLPPPPVFATRVAAVEQAMASVDPGSFTVQQAVIPLPDRTPVAEAAAALRLQEASLRLAEAQRLPSVTLNSNYGRVAYPSSFLSGFGSLRTNWTIGANVQVPILTGGRQRADEMVARADVEDGRLRLRQVNELAELDTRAAWAELQAARAVWEASAGTVEQATRAYAIADVRYRAGVSTQLELADSRLLLQQADANRAQAARDLQVARARVALLPELPLGTGVPAGSPAPPPPAPPAQTPGPGSLATTLVQGVPQAGGQ